MSTSSSLRAALDAATVRPSVWTVVERVRSCEEPYAKLTEFVPSWARSVEATYCEVDGYHGIYVCAWPMDASRWPGTPERADVRKLFKKPLIVGGTPAHFYVFENATEVDEVLDDPEIEAAHDLVLAADGPDEREAAQRTLRDLQLRRLARIQAIVPPRSSIDLARVYQLQREIDELCATVDD